MGLYVPLAIIQSIILYLGERHMHMSEKGYKLYGYRWVMLAVFMFINITVQILWITFATINGEAAS
ncbi:hypothetical protein ACFLYP_00200 [Chloroflexota bacterium]